MDTQNKNRKLSPGQIILIVVAVPVLIFLPQVTGFIGDTWQGFFGG